MAEVRLSQVHKAFGATPVLQGIDLHIADGEFVVFVGPSGCGKSTLLRCIAGLEEITSGTLHIGPHVVNDLPPSERGIAMVFQSYALYPHMNLYDNMAFGLELARRPKAEIDTAVRQAAEILHIGHLLDRLPKDLSGGQRQRVAIGRAIVRQPEVFLFDEPLSNLDTALRVKMRYEFARLHEQLKRTMVYVTHDQTEAMTLADRIVVLRAGRIEQVGAPLELYQRPCNRFVAGFIGSPAMNFLAGELVSADAQGATVRLKGGAVLRCAVDARTAPAGMAVALGVRPEHLRLALSSDAGGANAVGTGIGSNTLGASVTFVEALGSATFAYLEHPAAQEALTCTVSGDLAFVAQGRVVLEVPPGRTHLFDADGRAFGRLES